SAARKMAPLLSSVSAERIRDELLKILLSDRPDMLRLMDDTGILPLILPEFSALRGVTQNTKYHVYDVFDHSLQVIANVPKTPVLRLSALLHDTGKPAKKSTDDKGTDHFYGHPVVSTKIAAETLSRLRLDNKTIAQVKALVEHHDYRFSETKKSVRRMLSRIGPELFYDLLALMRADAMGQNPAMLSERLTHYETVRSLAEEIQKDGDALSVSDLAITGNDLLAAGYSGKEIGKALSFALDLVLENPAENETENLLKKLKNRD
ncbi:MAG: HD domain-containing protein, partial [Clostridia bacterium]|nr:HD domain-containing protein [Clostridia bacterium]